MSSRKSLVSYSHYALFANCYPLWGSRRRSLFLQFLLEDFFDELFSFDEENKQIFIEIDKTGISETGYEINGLLTKSEIAIESEHYLVV